MFTTLIVQPIFNLLVLVYALWPGHNFGISLIIFTIIVRLLFWPLVKRQLRQTKAMQKLQPDIKLIKKKAKNRQEEQLLTMELYKERGINPFSTFPIIIVQTVILIGLYLGLRRVIKDPHTLITFAYPPLQHLSWIQHLSHNIHAFDNTLFGVINLSRAALNPGGGIYWPAMLLVIGSAAAQFLVSGQLMPKTDDQRNLRDILRAAGEGKEADQAEVNAAIGRKTRYLLPGMIFLFTVNLASALSLYWLVGGVVAYIQQALVLRQDEGDLEALADGPTKKNVADIPEAEVVTPATSKKSSKPKKSKNAAKRRKK